MSVSESLIRSLLGCEWGNGITIHDDNSVCDKRAERIIVLHDGPNSESFKLCAEHAELVLMETTPHKDES